MLSSSNDPQHPPQVLRHAPPQRVLSRNEVLAAVRQDERALKYASEDLRADREVVSTAIRCNNMGVVRHASKDLRTDPEMVLVSVLRSGSRKFEYDRYTFPIDIYPDALLIDRTQLMAALTQLRSLNLSSSRIDTQAMEFLTPFLKTAHQLQRLDFSDNPLGGHQHAGLLHRMGMNESGIEKLTDIVLGDYYSPPPLSELRELNLAHIGSADRRDADHWNSALSLLNPFVSPLTVPPREPQEYISKIQNHFKLDSLRLNFYDNPTSPRLVTEFDRN